ncbi:MAG: ChaN family lipoprotein [Bacteroidota bacterium]
MIKVHYLLFTLLIVLFSQHLWGQQTAKQLIRIYDVDKGKEISLEELSQAAGEVDVLFWGEEHNDSLGHIMQDSLYHLLLEQHGTASLSLEMFETDCQYILDEYLAGFILEDKFLKASRPWSDYKKFYRPMVERAKEQNQAVIAANTPRRYINLVGRKGKGELENLPKVSRQYLPPLPIYTDDVDYKKRFDDLMASFGGHGGDSKAFQAQCTWDATMAHSIFTHWKKNKKSLIFHLCGRFHSDYQEGTMNQLRRLKRNIKAANVSCFPVEDLSGVDWSEYEGLGNYVVVHE